MRRRGARLIVLLGLAACGEVTPPAAPVLDLPAPRHVRRHVGAAVPGATAAAAPSPADEAPADVARLRGADTERLVALLATTAGRRRRDVAYELVRRGPPESAFAPLLDIATDDDDACIAAAHALACFGEPALSALRERLAAVADPDDDLASDLQFAIDEIEWLVPPAPVVDTREASCAGPPPSPTIDRLREELCDESPDVRRAAAVAAGEKREEARELAPLMAAALARDDAWGLDDIAAAMSRVGAGPSALLVLRARMASARTYDLRAGMEALGELGEIARDDVAARAPQLLADAGEFERRRVFEAMWRTGVDPAPYRAALVASLRGGECDLRHAARLLEAHPVLARELRGELVAALEAPWCQGSNPVAKVLVACGGLPPGDAARLLDDVEPFRLGDVVDAIGSDSARPGDDVALRLWRIVLDEDDDSRSRHALDALERADAIDEQDIPRLLDAMERKGRGVLVLGRLCRTTTEALPRLRLLLERDTAASWPLAMMGPRAAPALPRLVLEARDQDGYSAYAVGAIGVAGVEPLRRVLEGQHPVLRDDVLSSVMNGVHYTAEDRDPAAVDAACRGFLSVLAGCAPDEVGRHLRDLECHEDEDIRWAAERLR